MKIIEEKIVPDLAKLYLADLDGDGKRLIEFVDTVEPGVSKDKKWVLMISTQVGCAVGCKMCDAGAMGFYGNLTAQEMLTQAKKVISDNPDLAPASHPKLKIHFARMGEPSLNPAVLQALELFRKELPFDGFMPSLSTVAPKTPEAIDFFEKLIEIKNRHYNTGNFQLQFSLHALEEQNRNAMVPIATWPLSEIATYGKKFVRPGDRKITLNFALKRGERLEAKKLRDFFDPSLFLIKITPINPTDTADSGGLSFVWNETPDFISEDADNIKALGFDIIISPSAPEEINAETSCGQLWAATLKERAKTEARALRLEASSYLTSANLKEKSVFWENQFSMIRPHPASAKPVNSALLIIDMQEFFLNRQSPAYMPQAAAILGNTLKLVAAYREAGLPVFFTAHAHEDPETDGGLMTTWWKKICLTGTRWAEVSPLLGAQNEQVFYKTRYSGFTNPELEKTLRRSQVENLTIAGVFTNLCVESTARAAFDLSFPCIIALDATAAHTENLHTASLQNLAHGFAELKTTGELCCAIIASPVSAQIAS